MWAKRIISRFARKNSSITKAESRMSPPLMVTEDTPPDMLAGAMDLRLVLPNGSRVKMSVDRRTPMMDLLVQVTTAYKISPAGHVLQPYGESGLLPYKPSTPIGALDTWTVHIVPKHQALQNPANKISLKQVIQPFEQTFRFQVNLPRNQLYVTRVNGRTTMSEILEQACREKGLDISRYSLKHPKQLDGVSLCEELSVAEYSHNQVTMVSNRTLPSSVSSEDILAMHKYSNSSKSCESSSRSMSPASSVSPRQPVQPSRPLRKRRPAPKPPVSTSQHPTQSSLPKTTSANNQQKDSSSSNNGPVICHSRTSSDSSGYHEASVLSESPDSNNSSLPDSLPRRSKLPSSHEPSCSGVKQKLSRSLSNLHQASSSATVVNGSSLPPSSRIMKSAQSTSSLAPSRKKKPAPPPPVFSIAEEREETLSTASRSSKTLPAGTRLQECQAPVDSPSLPVELPPAPPVESSIESKPVPPTNPSHISDTLDNIALIDEGAPVLVDSSDSSSIVTPSETERIEAEIERMFEQATREHVSLESGVDLGESPERLPSPPSQRNKLGVETEDPFMDWEYKLPAPPTFRDDVCSPPLTEYSTMTVGKMKDVLYENTNNNRTVAVNSGNAALMDELSTAIVDRKVLRTQPSSQLCIEDTKISSLDNFHITTYEGQGKRTLVRMYSEEDNNKKITNFNEEIKNENNSDILKEEKTEFMMMNGQKQNEIDSNLWINKNVVDSTEKISNGGSSTVFITSTNGPSYSNNAQQLGPKQVGSEQMKSLTVYKNENHSNNEIQIKKTFNVLDQENEYKERLISPVMRTSSFVQDRKETPQIKRSVSYVSCLAKARLNMSKSNSDLLESSEEENNFGNVDQQIRLHLRPVARSNLRKTTSELSINIDLTGKKKILEEQESGLQSLQVLRSILPQISQSQGSMNTVGINSSDIAVKEEQTVTFVRPKISVSTWGERPKRQVSIKSDRDYVFGQKVVLKPVSQVVKTSVPPPPQPKPLITSDKRTKPSVYKTLETGNTKPIKLQQEPPSSMQQATLTVTEMESVKVSPSSCSLSSRLPVVRSVELKKPYQLRQQEPPSQQQQRPVSCYLFGCQPSINESTQSEKKFTSIVGINQTPTPPPPPPSIVHLKPVSSKRCQLPSPQLDPREELLRSIRSFGGRDSLRKVSTR